jgi:glycosyltransferase involved in cell wall biosynthesis
MKNEAHNIGPFLKSVNGCFDEIILVDTGSTDNTLEFVENVNRQREMGSTIWDLPEIKVYHFDWVNDFAKAREFAFSKATKDYIAWLDLDDSLSDAEAFKKWRDNVMHSAHFWVALYNYAFDAYGKPVCQFIRERVIKRNHGFHWEYPVHEGLIQKEDKKFWGQRATTWWVNHRRTDEDRKQDHMRNIKIIESLNLDEMHPRMKFYYGKELFENGFAEKAGKPLLEAAKSEKLDIHDRILTIQYAGQSAFAAKAWPQLFDLLYNGVKLVPNRAEYWCLLGDAYAVTGDIPKAFHAYKCAAICTPNDFGGTVVVHQDAYGEYPHRRIAELSIQTGDWLQAQQDLDVLHEMKSPSVTELEVKLAQMKDLDTLRTDLPKVSDVIITVQPGMPGDWDEHTLETKGVGGSETAAIEVARWIRKKTSRRVKVFQPRVARAVMPSGVEYEPVADLAGYVRNVEPTAHIAWRHPTKLTNAKTFAWCHDLQMPGADKGQFDKIVALSEFHKNYLIETNGVPEHKIVVGFNGINPNDFEVDAEKDPLKVVFSSSPDRGLVQSIDIVAAARKASGLDIKLHCFYGTGNMRKMGLTEWADKIEKKIEDNKEFVTYHGMVKKKELMRHFKEAAVWLYPADFIETSCITAMEAMCAGAWPIVRDMGALKYTMKDAIERECVDMLDIEVTNEGSIGIWANTLVEAILDKKWQKMDFSAENYSWEKVADWFIKEMNLGDESQAQS